MSDYNSLKATINANVKTNGNQEITGSIMNITLRAMVDSLGAGYQYRGVATPTSPSTDQTPDYRCFYIATTPGTYAHLGGLVVNESEVAILKYDTSWHKDVTGAANAIKAYEHLLNNCLVGNGNSYVSQDLQGLTPGRKYRIVFHNPNWDITGVTDTSTYRFEIVSYYNNATTILVRILLDGNVPPTLDFVIPQNSDYVRIYGKASVGTKIEFNVIDMTSIDELNYSLLRLDSYLFIRDSFLSVSQTISNKYIDLTGSLVTASNVTIKEFDVSDCDLVRASITVYGGSAISLISGFDSTGKFLYSFTKGTSSSIVDYSQIIDCKALGITKIALCGDTARIGTAKVEKLKFSPADSIARDGVDLIINDTYTKKIPVSEESTTTGAYVRTDGVIIQNSAFSYKTYDVSNLEKVFASATILGGRVVSVISGFDEDDNFVQSFADGDSGSARVDRTAEINVRTLGIAKIRLSTTAADIGTCAVFEFAPSIEKSISKVQTWGDSVTAAGKYQSGLASVLMIGTSDVKNAGLASDYSMHVRRRFLSYFTDETPYVGTATYSVPSFAERQEELENSFFVFWFGTNNLINPNRSAGASTTGSDAFNALQPNPDFKYDRLYSRAYVDMMFNDIRQVVDLLPHKNFVIIGGHGGFMSESDMRTKMIELDNMLARMYPRNFVDVRELVNMDYDFQDVHLGADFIKPALNTPVNIVLNKTDWIGQNGNTSNNICIGTKTIYDKYHVVSVINSTTISAELIESNTEFVEGDTIRAEYLLVSDLGRDAVNMLTRVYSYEDCVSFGLMSFPRSSSDPIHFTNDQYHRIGELIAYEILKMKLS